MGPVNNNPCLSLGYSVNTLNQKLMVAFTKADFKSASKLLLELNTSTEHEKKQLLNIMEDLEKQHKNQQPQQSNYTSYLLQMMNASEWGWGDSEIQQAALMLINLGLSTLNSQNGPNLETPLHWAANELHAKYVEALLKNGAKPNAPIIAFSDCDSTLTPLEVAFLALKQGSGEDIFEMILKYGGDQAISSSGSLLLVEAIERDLNNTVKVLIERVDVNDCDDDGRTPLFLAVSKFDIPLTKMLLDKGAKPNTKCPMNTIFPETSHARHNAHFAQKISPLFLATFYARWEIVALLLSYGADPLTSKEASQFLKERSSLN